VVVSGHNGCQSDLRLVASKFMKIATVPVSVHSDPELVAGRYPGDHAGRFEISQLLHCRPELVDLDRATTDPLGRFAQGLAAAESTPDYGELVIEAMIDRVGALVHAAEPAPAVLPFLSFADVEPAWTPSTNADPTGSASTWSRTDLTPRGSTSPDRQV
jgi:creatinine amidohydrolase